MKSLICLVISLLVFMIGCGQPDIFVTVNNYIDTTEVDKPIDTCSTKEVGSLSAKVILGKVDVYGLAKVAAINVNRLVLEFSNNSTYTLKDTTSISIPQGTADTITKLFPSLPALRTYKVVAKTLDTRDSVIHKDSTTFVILPSDTTYVTLNLLPLFTVYEANFLSMPDTVQSGTGEKSSIGVDSLVVYIDGSAVADSSVRPLFFTESSNVKVTFDYVRVGSHSIVLEAYGTINDYTGVLYRGSKTVLFDASVDNVETVTMSWVGPTTGTGSIEVRIGRVGKVTANGTLPGTIIP
jgi:hypothetical protein